LEEQLTRTQYRAVTITQVETSTGVRAPVAELAAVAKRHGALVIIDAVCSLGGMPVDMDALNLDIVLSGAQKALGVPPGMTILLASQEAMERRRGLRQPPGYYTDLLNWEPSMQDPLVYFSTHTVNLFYALLAGLEIIEREGLPARFERHDGLGSSFRAGMAALGFSSLTAPAYLSPTMSVLAYPEGVDDAAFRSLLSGKGVVVASCLGDFKGRGARFGHMGNITESDVLRGVAAIEATLDELDVPLTPGSGVANVRRALVEPEAVAR
jgi:alanine-glyoxylate transaminase/serine-glyoxylate transaminase/serine-pyruvate transaminase